MDNVASVMMQKIKQLDTAMEELTKRSDARTDAQCEYDEALKDTMSLLKNGKEYMVEGESCKWTSVTDADKIAKGLITDKTKKLLKAESALKDLHLGIRILESQLMTLSNLNKTHQEI